MKSMFLLHECGVYMSDQDEIDLSTLWLQLFRCTLLPLRVSDGRLCVLHFRSCLGYPWSANEVTDIESWCLMSMFFFPPHFRHCENALHGCC